MKHTRLALALAVSMPTLARAQNLAPELMLEGTCDELVVWASRPAEKIRADLDSMLGTTTDLKMSEDIYNTMMGVLKDTALGPSWFARPCTFDDSQLAAMAPLKDAYVAHMADKLSPE